MSFEETLVCDACSNVIDGGPRGVMIEALHRNGGASFVEGRDGNWERIDDGWRAERHICGDCASEPFFYDGQQIPREAMA